MLEYAWRCQNKQGFENTKVLNIPVIIQSLGSLCKALMSYWDGGRLKTFPDC